MKTTQFGNGTLLETIESQTQQELLYQGLENYAEVRRSRATPGEVQARTVLDAVAEAAVAQAATQSMLAGPDENLIETVRKAKVQRTDSDKYEWV